MQQLRRAEVSQFLVFFFQVNTWFPHHRSASKTTDDGRQRKRSTGSNRWDNTPPLRASRTTRHRFRLRAMKQLPPGAAEAMLEERARRSRQIRSSSATEASHGWTGHRTTTPASVRIEVLRARPAALTTSSTSNKSPPGSARNRMTSSGRASSRCSFAEHLRLDQGAATKQQAQRPQPYRSTRAYALLRSPS